MSEKNLDEIRDEMPEPDDWPEDTNIIRHAMNHGWDERDKLAKAEQQELVEALDLLLDEERIRSMPFSSMTLHACQTILAKHQGKL